jgi:hypothetical protein
MTRKDYIEIAAKLSAERTIHTGYPEAQRAIENLTFSLADVMARDNRNFNRQRFYCAAGMPKERYA